MAHRKRHIQPDRQGYYRANRVGVMLIVMTLCQYGVPTIILQILTACGVDVSARSWGLNSSLYLLLYLIMYVLMMGVPLIISKILLIPQTRRPVPLKLSLDRKLCVVLCALALCLLANIAAAVFSGALYQAGLRKPEMMQLGDGSIITLLMDLVVFAIVPAVMEETLLRGMVLQTLRPLGNGVAVAISAVLFGLMHGNLEQAPYALLMGLILGTVFVHTDNLRLTIVIHALANGLSVIASFLLQFFDTDFATFWELLILIISLMMGGVAALWLYRHPLIRRTRRLATASARKAALLHAPFLWLAVLMMTVLMIL